MTHAKPLTPAKPFHLPPVLLGGAAGAAVALRQAEFGSDRARRRVISKAVGCGLGAHPLGDQPAHFKDPFVPGLAYPDRVSRHERLGCLGRVAIQAHVPRPAGCCGCRPGFIGADCPQPGIDPDGCGG